MEKPITRELPFIMQPRVAYKPFSYPQYFEYYKRAVSTVWRVETVDMNSDIKDYLIRSTEDEKEIIAGILRGFTILETHIGDYWSDRVCTMFPKHEIVAAARANAFFECIHAQAYAHLNDSLGLDDYEAFLTDPATRKKIEFFVDHPNDLISLAIFSGAGEGVSLFSSFTVLLSLSRDSRYKGLAQIISWSVRDENEHSEMGCELFRDLVKERGITTEEIEGIYSGFNTVLENEFDFINQIFEGRVLDNLRIEELKDYMYIRANNRLEALGLEAKYEVSGEGYNLREWFENECLGQSSNDFFWQSLSGDNYTSLLSQDFMNHNYSIVNTKWKD
jgi:ribonucleoside-diphosphate reductase beta chain